MYLLNSTSDKRLSTRPDNGKCPVIDLKLTKEVFVVKKTGRKLITDVSVIKKVGVNLIRNVSVIKM